MDNISLTILKIEDTIRLHTHNAYTVCAKSKEHLNWLFFVIKLYDI